MDILPEYLIKAIIAGDIDRMEALGIYEVARRLRPLRIRLLFKDGIATHRSCRTRYAPFRNGVID